MNLGIKLVIVESPAKARKIGAFLGDDYVVEASVGHIRDLPQRAADIPAEYKKIAWAKEGVNIAEDFAPLYVINPDKRAKVNELKALMKNADELLEKLSTLDAKTLREFIQQVKIRARLF